MLQELESRIEENDLNAEVTAVCTSTYEAGIAEAFERSGADSVVLAVQAEDIGAQRSLRRARRTLDALGAPVLTVAGAECARTFSSD